MKKPKLVLPKKHSNLYNKQAPRENFQNKLFRRAKCEQQKHHKDNMAKFVIFVISRSKAV